MFRMIGMNKMFRVGVNARSEVNKCGLHGVRIIYRHYGKLEDY